MNRCECEISTNKKILEKKPAKGGTPARERSVKLNTFVRMLEVPRLESENSVLRLVWASCKKVEKSKNDVRL